MTVIDPNDLSIDPQHKAILLSLLNQGEEDRYGWGENRWYEVEYKEKKIDVSLANTVIKRQSKNGDVRYDVIDQQPLGSGGYGTVYPITLTYKIVDNELIAKYKPLGKRRIAKRIDHEYDKAVVDKAVAEYKMTDMAPHLSAKLPVVYDDWIFLVLRRVEGKELFEIIEDDLSGKKVLTLEQRYQLTINLIRAVQEQVFEAGLVHRDLKPENIIVDLETGNVSVIDYGLAKIGEMRIEKDSVGSAVYASPEVFIDLGTTRYSDVYSLGRIIGLIWHNDMSSYSSKLSAEDRLWFARKNDYSNLFRGLAGIEPQAMLTILQTLQNMTAYKSTNRPELTDALVEFRKAILFQFPPPPVNKKKTSKKIASTSKLAKQKGEKNLKERLAEFKKLEESNAPIVTVKTKKWGRFFTLTSKDKKNLTPTSSPRKQKAKSKKIVAQQSKKEDNSFDMP